MVIMVFCLDTEHFSRGRGPRDNFVFRRGGGLLFGNLQFNIKFESPPPTLDPLMIGIFSINSYSQHNNHSVPMSLTFYLCLNIND